MHRSRRNLWSALSHDVLSVVLIFYCFIAVWFVGGLTVFHFYLICTNETSYENFQYRYDKKENPYSRGMFRNIMELFFYKIPRPLVDFRAWTTEEEETVHGSVTSDVDDGFLLSNGKFDLEKGGSLGKDGVTRIPSILQSFDYTGVDEKLKRKVGGGDDKFDAFFFPPEVESRFSENTASTEQDVSGDMPDAR